MNENELTEEPTIIDELSFGKGLALATVATVVLTAASIATVAIGTVLTESLLAGVDTLREKRAERKAAKQKKTEV